MTALRLFLGLASLLLLAASPVWSAPQRVALVVGNARYEPAVGKLNNTANDAKAVAQTLRSLGFAVTERHDLTRDQFLRVMEDFRKSIPGTEVALFYYAGHGISIGGSNYLIPIKSGFDPSHADDVALRMLAETRLFNAEQAVADMSAAGAQCNLVILDACRNTPLAKLGRTRSITDAPGLSEMTPPAGSLIAFSTDAGRVASDGDGTNGLYTGELLKNLRTPGLTIEQVFKRTRAGVLARSHGSQVPAEYSRLVGEDVYLAGQSRPEPIATPDQTTVSAAEVLKFANAGEVENCLEGLKALAAAHGPGEYAAAPLHILLDRVKEDLRNASVPSPRVTAAANTCAEILRILPECLPLDHPQANAITAMAYNRRGDALLILGNAEEALKAFNSAIPLAPADAYILLNRGRAYAALGNKDDARADFLAAAEPRYNQPKARRLAEQALANLK